MSERVLKVYNNFLDNYERRQKDTKPQKLSRGGLLARTGYQEKQTTMSNPQYSEIQKVASMIDEIRSYRDQ
jgi:hypothetical protein